MADTSKVLGQLNPSATTLTDLYTVPALTTAVVSGICVANTNSTAASFRISIAVAGAANNIKQYLYYDLPINGNDTFIVTTGITLGAADVIRVYASNTNLVFNAFGIETA